MNTGRKKPVRPESDSAQTWRPMVDYAHWLFRASDIAATERECEAVAKTLLRLAPGADCGGRPPAKAPK